MDHVVYLDYKARELEKLRIGEKSMIIRGAMGRKLPYGRVSPGDILYFIENRGDGLVKAKAVVNKVFNSHKLEKDASFELIGKHREELRLNDGLLKRFGGKRYLVLISVSDFQDIAYFGIDRSDYGNMDDWLPVGDIETVKTTQDNSQL